MSNFLFSFFLIFIGVFANAKVVFVGDSIDGYRSLIGADINQLKQIVKGAKIEFSPLPAHEPEEYVSAFLVSLQDKSFFVLGINRVDALLFRDESFKSLKGVRVGQNFCEIVKLYPEAKFNFEFSEGGVLQLHVDIEKITLDFDTSNLPIGKYISQKRPSKNDSTLCSSVLTSIKLSKI